MYLLVNGREKVLRYMWHVGNAQLQAAGAVRQISASVKGYQNEYVGRVSGMMRWQNVVT